MGGDGIEPPTSRGMDEATLGRYAELIVRLAAAVRPGQVVEIGSEVGKEALTRAVAAEAFRAGARHVGVEYDDAYVTRSRILHGADDALGYTPAWARRRVQELSELHGAFIYLAGAAAPGLLDGLDAERVGRDRTAVSADWEAAINARTINWTTVPAPTPGWAALAHPELDAVAALDRLWDEVLHVCRMDTDDPAAAWRARAGDLRRRADRLTDLRLDRLHFSGPGTDLVVGLLPTSRWNGGVQITVDGIAHLPNLPTEEVFTTPDPDRTEGVARATKPREVAGAIIHGIELVFEAGRAVEIRADSGADTLGAMAARDDGGSRLGEVALVDATSPIAALDTVFYSPLLDENAASHIALGAALEACVGPADLDRINRSDIHIDLMIGADDVAVTGVTAAGDRVELITDGRWAFL